MKPGRYFSSLMQGLARLSRVRVRDRGFLLLLAASYVVARTAGGVLPVTVFYSLLLLGLTCFVWTRWMHSGLSVIYDCDRYRLQRGEPVNVSLRVENEGIFPVPWLRISDTTGSWESVMYQDTGRLGSMASLVRRYQISSMPRGRYRPGPLLLEAGDPLGLFVTEKRHQGHRYLVVYPRIRIWTQLELPLRQPFGRFKTPHRSYQDPSSLAGIRDFRQGDSPRHIDWKATAKRSRLQVREYDLTATGAIQVVLDLSRGQDPHDLELAVDGAASLAASSLTRGLETSFLARGRTAYHLPPGRRTSHLNACLEILATVRADGTAPAELVLERARRSARGATLCLLTTRLDPSTAGAIVRMNPRNPVVLFLAGKSTPSLIARQLAAGGVQVYRLDQDLIPRPEEGDAYARVL